MFWREGGIELLTPRKEPAILTTRPQSSAYQTKGSISITNIYGDAGRDKPLQQNLFWPALLRTHAVFCDITIKKY